MRIIPVIDIKGGRVVAAKEGRRETYPPLKSRLTDRTDPASVIEGMLKLHSFSAIYLADLDALMGRGSQSQLLETLAACYPALEFWVDQGVTERSLLGALAANITPVIGTESLDTNTLRRLAAGGTNFILSLDFHGDRLLGRAGAAQEPGLWPNRLIVMSLSHVGSGRGPDYARLREFRQRYPEKGIIAAGGVRNAQDLRKLDAMGMHAALLASALHNGEITAELLQAY